MHVLRQGTRASRWKSNLRKNDRRGQCMGLVKAFLDACAQAGESPCLISGDECLSLPELLRRASLLATSIKNDETDGGDFIAVLLPNSFDFAVGFWAALLAGRTVMPLNFMLKSAEIAPLFRHSGARTLLTSSPFKPVVESVQSILESPLRVIYLDEHLQRTGENPPVISHSEVNPDASAVLLYTAGTTGQSKGVLLSHKNLLANLEGCQRILDTGPADTFLGILPYFHAFGLTTSFLLPLLTGSRIVLCPSLNPQAILDKIMEERVTALIMVPTIYGLLLKHPGTAKADLGSVRMAVSGGGPLSPAIEEGFQSMTGKPVFNGYGLTEASPVVSVNMWGNHKKGSIGRPLHNVGVSIRDEEGQSLPACATGEICVSGENVMLGYHNMTEEMHQSFSPDGALRTGDMGYLDEDGFLFIAGRKKEIILCGGENIQPVEIENVLSAHPAVEEAAVVGVPDTLRGERPRAYVRLREGCVVSALELKRFCHSYLASFKVPREIIFVSEFPRNALGKVLKWKLLDLPAREQL